MNLFDGIEAVAMRQPGLPAVVAGGQWLSYRRLVTLTASAAHRLARAGVMPGDIAMVLTRPPLENLLLTLSLMRLGAVVVSCGSYPAALRAELASRFGVRAFVGHAELLPAPGGIGAAVCVDQQVALSAPDPADETFANCQRSPQAPLRISLSSGTTGVPKGVVWSQGSAQANFDVLSEMAAVDRAGAGYFPGDRNLVFLDLGTNYGANQSLRTLLEGVTLVLPLAPTASDFIRCLDLNGVSTVMTSTPFAISLLDAVRAGLGGGPAHGRFPTLRRIALAGEAISTVARQAMISLITPNTYVAYGCSECGAVSWSTPEVFDAHPDCAGLLTPGVEVEALDPAGAVLPLGQTGQLRFRTRAMCDGYLGDAALTAATFRDGWYLSPDMGSVDDQGVVRLGVREQDMLVIGGKKVDPSEIELLINALPHVQESAVFMARGGPDEDLLVALFVADAPVAPALVRQKCLAALGPMLTPRQIAQVDKIPRTDGGKLSRKQLGQLFVHKRSGSVKP